VLVVLSVTGLMGLLFLCVFIYALILGAVGFMFNMYLDLLLSIMFMHFFYSFLCPFLTDVCWVLFSSTMLFSDIFSAP